MGNVPAKNPWAYLAWGPGGPGVKKVVPACPRQSLSLGANFNQSMEGVKLPCGVHSCSVVTARVTGKNMENICSSKEMSKVLFNIS